MGQLNQKEKGRQLQRDYENYLLASERRIQGTRTAINTLREYLGCDEILLLNRKEAQSFQTWLITDQKGRFSASSVRALLGPLNSFYDYLKKRNLVMANPFRLIDKIALPHRLPGNIPNEKDMDALLAHLSDFTRGRNLRDFKTDYKAHVLCELLYSTGMRIHEAAAIRLGDLDLQSSTVLVRDSKTKSERIAFLNDYTRQILNLYVEEFREKVLWLHNGADEDLLFGTTTNLQIWLNAVLAKACKEMKREKITSHMFRHAFGYHMLRAGCDVRKIQKFLGHQKLSTTAIYAKVDTESLRNVLDQYHPRNPKRQSR